MMDFFLCVVATEALTELIFKAGPLQLARHWIIGKTPCMYSVYMQSHLLECKYCTSFWVGIILFTLYKAVDSPTVLWFIYAVSVPRLANFLHLPFSWLRDVQLDIRVERNRRT